MEQGQKPRSFFRLFTPLEGELYEKDENGVRKEDSRFLTSYETAEYASLVQREIERMNREHMGSGGLAEFLEEEGLKARVIRMLPTAEAYGGRLWGVLEVQTDGPLSSEEMRAVRREWSRQAKDGWGRSFAKQAIAVNGGELYVSFYNDGPDAAMLMEQELKSCRPMEVCITAQKYRRRSGYQPALLRLPAGRYELSDALQRALAQEGDEYNVQMSRGCPGFLKNALSDAAPFTLQELNLLAEKVCRMNDSQWGIYEGILKLRQDGDIDHPMTMKELINAAYRREHFAFYLGVVNDRVLGELCIENEMLDWLEGLPDEVMELLDEEKIGSALRRSEQGTFISRGYVSRSTPDGSELYDGIHPPEQMDAHDGVISLRLEAADSDEGQNTGVWLELPADEAAMREALYSLKETTFDDCRIAETKSMVPALRYPFAGDEDMEKLNTLAWRIKKFSDDRTLMKYKAVLELELCNELDMALDIAGNLDCYDFDPKIVSPEDYAEYVLREAGLDTDDPAFFNFDFSGYGKRQLEGSAFVSTAYGMIARNDRSFRQEYTAIPRQGMTMQ